MSRVSAPADRRFRRAHLKPAAARRGWRRTMRLLRYLPFVVLAAYGVYLASRTVAHARVLHIDRVLVRGNERLSEGEILALLAGLRGESLLWTDLGRWRARLLASPWVQEAALRRSLPSTVEVVVWERRPIGIARLAASLYLVDGQGTIVDQYGPQYAELDLPIIDGLATSSPIEEPATDPARAALASRLIAALQGDAAIARRLSQVFVADLHNAQVILADDPAIISLGEDQFLARLQNYLELAETLRERVEGIDAVDVRFDNRIYVRPARRQAAARERLTGRPAANDVPSASAQRP